MDIVVLIVDEKSCSYSKLNNIMLGNKSDNIIIFKVGKNNTATNIDELFDIKDKIEVIKNLINNGFKLCILDTLLDRIITKTLKNEYTFIKKVYPIEMDTNKPPFGIGEIKWFEYED